jgi:hypothetical protein
MVVTVATVAEERKVNMDVMDRQVLWDLLVLRGKPS